MSLSRCLYYRNACETVTVKGNDLCTFFIPAHPSVILAPYPSNRRHHISVFSHPSRFKSIKINDILAEWIDCYTTNERGEYKNLPKGNVAFSILSEVIQKWDVFQLIKNKRTTEISETRCLTSARNQTTEDIGRQFSDLIILYQLVPNVFECSLQGSVFIPAVLPSWSDYPAGKKWADGFLGTPQ